MMGTSAVRRTVRGKKKVIRPKLPGVEHLGFQIIPRPRDGYAHYHIAEFKATKGMLSNVIRPHETTLVDVELARVVHDGVFALTKDQAPNDFRDQLAGGMIA